MRQYFGAAILGFFVLYLYFEGSIQAYSSHPVIFGFLILLMLLTTLSIGLVFNRIEKASHSYPLFGKEALIDFLSVFLGAILTFFLSVYLEVNAVLASGLIGTLAAIFSKPYAVAIFCGSFLGMSSPEVFDVFPFFVATVLASSIYVTAKDVFNGFGGKLGTIALSGCFIATLIHSEPLLEGSLYGFEYSLLIIATAFLGAVISNLLNIRFSQGAVFSSSGMTLAIVMFGASFVGMSNRKVLGNEALVGLTGVVFGVLFVVTAHALGGLGDKLGTLALSSVLAIYGAYFLYTHFPKGVETHE